MKTFYTDYNNGVQVLVSESVMEDLRKKTAIRESFRKSDESKDRSNTQNYERTADEATAHLGTPIFTFARGERVKEQPWFTGDTNLLESLRKHIEANGGQIVREGIWVPFSNGLELGWHGMETMKRELQYVTTEQQFRDTFGISIIDLITTDAMM